MTYEEGVEGIGDVGLGDVAGGQEVLEGLKEVPAGHRLVEVEAVVTWLEQRLKINGSRLPVCGLSQCHESDHACLFPFSCFINYIITDL